MGNKLTAEGRIRAAFARADAQIAQLKSSQTLNEQVTDNSIGTAFINLATMIANDPTEQAGSIEKGLTDEIAAAERQMRNGVSVGLQLKAAIAYLDGDTSQLSAIRDIHLKSAAIAAKSGIDAGIVDPTAYIRQLNNIADEIAVTDRRMRSKFLASAKSAANLVRTKARIAANQWVNQRTADRYKLLLNKQRAAHRKQFSRMEGSL